MVREIVEEYLEVLGGKGGSYDWRALPDQHKERRVVKLRGKLDDVGRQLEELNQEQYGIFVTVNETDGSGVTKNNITRVRALWVDLDGCESMPYVPLEPSMTVRTKNGFHLYWIMDEPCDITWAEAMNKRMAEIVGGDLGACDAARVLRVPGFYHCKGDACLVTLVKPF